MSHTPGPWRIYELLGNTFIDAGQSYNPDRIARVLSQEFSYVTAANARLIAAAPDLLEALEGIMKYQHTQQVRQPYAVMKPEYEELFLTALAAIKKARGEA